MTPWVLVLVLFSSGDSERLTVDATMRFTTEQACTVAADKVRAALAAMPLTSVQKITPPRIATTCVRE